MIHASVLAALEKHRGDLPRVAQESGVSYRTLQKVVSGEIENPGVNTLQPLIDWLVARGELLSEKAAA